MESGQWLKSLTPWSHNDSGINTRGEREMKQGKEKSIGRMCCESLRSGCTLDVFIILQLSVQLDTRCQKDTGRPRQNLQMFPHFDGFVGLVMQLKSTEFSHMFSHAHMQAETS